MEEKVTTLPFLFFIKHNDKLNRKGFDAICSQTQWQNYW